MWSLIFLIALSAVRCSLTPSLPDLPLSDTAVNHSEQSINARLDSNDVLPRASRFHDCSGSQYNDLSALLRTVRNFVSLADASAFVVSQGQVPETNTRFLQNFGSLQAGMVTAVRAWLARVTSVIEGTRDNVDVYCYMRRSQCNRLGRVSGYVSDGRRIILVS